MTEIRYNITIGAPPGRVWDRLIDIERYSDWVPRLKDVRNPRGEVGEAGSTYVSVYELPMGREMEVRSGIIESDRPERIVERFDVAGRLAGTGTWTLTQQKGEDSTHLDMQATIELNDSVLAGIAGPVALTAIERKVQDVMGRLKEVCEREAVGAVPR